MISSKDDARAQRLFEILGEIDPKMLGDIEKDKRNNKKILWPAVLGLAAAMALIAGVFSLRSMNGLATTTTAPTADGSIPVVTSPPPSTQPPASDTVISEQPADTDETIPEDKLDGIGGDEKAWVTLLVKQKFDGIDTCLSNLRGGEMWPEKWMDSMKDYGEATKLDETVNVYSFIKAFDISKEEAESAYEYSLDSGDDQLISRQELDIIYSGDELAVVRTLASDYAIVVGDRIYTPYWLYRHSAEDYAAAGISPEEIKQREDIYDKCFFYPDKAGLERGKEFYSKLKEYVPDIRFERLERFIGYSDITLNIGGAVYDISWLSSHTIQDFQAAGITVDDLKKVINIMEPYGYSDEYDWISACYQRMMWDLAGISTAENMTDISDDTDEVTEITEN